MRKKSYEYIDRFYFVEYNSTSSREQNMDIKKNVANNIANLRKKNRWTQAELAEKINYSDKAVSKWERGEAVPDIDTLYMLANLFNVKIDYFVYDDHEVQKEMTVPKIEGLFKKLAVLFLFSLATVLIALLIYVIGDSQNWDNKPYLWMSFIWATPILATITFVFFIINKIWLGSLISCGMIVVCLIGCIFGEFLIHNILGGNAWMVWLFVPIIVGAIVLIFFMRKSKGQMRFKQ